MSAFIRYQIKEFITSVDEFGRCYEPLINSSRVETKNIILNTLSIASKFEDPIEWSLSYRLRDIFLNGDSDREFIRYFKDNESREKLQNKINLMFKKIKEVYPNVDINYEYLNGFINEFSDNSSTYISDYEVVIRINGWSQEISYSPIIGGNTIEKLYVPFQTKEMAIEFREKIMAEVEEFYKNYASYIKNIIL